MIKYLSLFPILFGLFGSVFGWQQPLSRCMTESFVCALVFGLISYLLGLGLLLIFRLHLHMVFGL